MKDGLAVMRTNSTKTYSARPAEVTRQWLVIDAKDLVLGRLAADIAMVLRGKHKPVYTPHVDTGDHVIVVNAGELVLTGGKPAKTMRYRHSGWPGGLKSESYGALMERDPCKALKQAVKGMLPHGPLGRAMLRKLRVYRDGEHPHAAQGPVPFEPPHARKI